jgi:hypothetical protein
MPAVLKSSFSKCGIGTLSLVHPFQAAKGGPDPGNVSSALRNQAERTKICISIRWNLEDECRKAGSLLE